MTLIFAFGLTFQMPVLLTLLGRVGIVTSAQLRSAWRYAVVGIFALAAVITPPDAISMVSLAIPLVLLYEISIWCVKLIERQRAKDAAAHVAKSSRTLARPATSPWCSANEVRSYKMRSCRKLYLSRTTVSTADRPYRAKASSAPDVVKPTLPLRARR